MNLGGGHVPPCPNVEPPLAHTHTHKHTHTLDFVRLGTLPWVSQSTQPTVNTGMTSVSVSGIFVAMSTDVVCCRLQHRLRCCLLATTLCTWMMNSLRQLSRPVPKLCRPLLHHSRGLLLASRSRVRWKILSTLSTFLFLKYSG